MEGKQTLIDSLLENINFNISNEGIDPTHLQNPYSDIGNMMGGLIFKEFKKNEIERQHIRYQNIRGVGYVLKRASIKCELDNLKDIIEDLRCKQFVKDNLIEYEILKISSIHPSGLNVFNFSLIKLSSHNLLITEYLVKDVGTSLEKSLPSLINNPLISLKLLIQASDILSFFEKLKISFNSIRPESFAIDLQGNMKITETEFAQFVGFSRFSSKNNRLGVKDIKGYYTGFAAPELLEYAYSFKNNRLPIALNYFNPWKADIYSFGLLALVLFGNIDLSSIKDIDSLKIDAEQHKKIRDLIDKLEFPNNEELSKKISFVLDKCLEFDPKKRITFKALYKLLSKSLDISYFELLKLYDSLEYKRKNRQGLLKEKCYMLEQTVKKIEFRLRELEVENKNNLDKLREQTQEIDKSKRFLLKQYDPTLNINDPLSQLLSNILEKLMQNLDSQRKLLIAYQDENEKTIKKINSIFTSFTYDHRIKNIHETIDIIYDLICNFKPIDLNSLKEKTCPICYSQEETSSEIIDCYLNYRYISDKIKKIIEKNIQGQLIWDLSKFKFDSTELIIIFSLIFIHTKVEVIDFPKCKSTNDEIQHNLFTAIFGNKSLKGIILYKFYLSERFLKDVMDLIDRSEKIKFLIVKRDPIIAETAINIASKLKLDKDN